MATEMKTLRIIFSGSGGELDSRTIRYNPADDIHDGGAAAAEAAIEMIRECGLLHDGDTISVVEV